MTTPTEAQDVAAIVSIMKRRGTITGYVIDDTQKTVEIHMPGVRRKFTFLRFWVLFQNGEQAICCGAGAIELRSPSDDS